MDEHFHTRRFLRAAALVTLAIIGCEGGLISSEAPPLPAARADAGQPAVVDSGSRPDAGTPPFDAGLFPDAGHPPLCSPAWTCSDGNRERCDGGRFETETCGRGCLPGDAGAQCIFESGTWSCAGSSYLGTQYWTCKAGELHKCDGPTPLTVKCPNDCTFGPLGTDDVCDAPLPQGALGFGYPVGDKTSFPAGGWIVSQVLGHYLYAPPFVGGHLAEDIFSGTEKGTAGAQVYAVADGVVRYAGPNGSTYKNVVIIEHSLGGGQKVCSFYGHLQAPSAKTGAAVKRGEPIAKVLDWNATFGGDNSHLHYVLLTMGLCNTSVAASGALVCGYDKTSAPNGITDLSTEPATYTSVGDICGDEQFGAAFIAPSKFIKAHHF